MSYKSSLLLLGCLLGVYAVQGQVELMRQVAGNGNDQLTGSFQFSPVIRAQATPVENQGASGTCWSFSANSFLESEMIRQGEPALLLSPLYTVRCAYLQKAINYVRMHGALSWGEGGEPHDVIDMYARYGAIPESAYPGLREGVQLKDLGEMMQRIKTRLDSIIQQDSLPAGWQTAVQALLDAYMGPVPDSFRYQGDLYTPREFARKVVRLDPADYTEFISQTSTPYWEKAMMMVPDNWSFQHDWNIPMNDITKIIDYSLKQGYTVVWGTDVSERSFSWKNGIAYVPAKPYASMSPDQRTAMFAGPQPERVITPELRQQALDNYRTTDDHGMHIIGIARDQDGQPWYIVKNSWGTGNDYQGYLYVSKSFVRYKTTSFLVNRHGIPPDILDKLDKS